MAQEKNTPQVKTPTVTIVESSILPQVVYADRITNARFGSAVSRLILAKETSVPNTFTPTVTVVIPTSALLEMISGVVNAIQGSPEVTDGILKGLDSLKAQVNAIKTA